MAGTTIMRVLRAARRDHADEALRPCAGRPPGSSRDGTARPARCRARPPPGSRGRSRWWRSPRRRRHRRSRSARSRRARRPPTPSSSGCGRRRRSRFQPMCGTGRSPSKRRTRPGSRPRPRCAPVLLALLEQHLHADADAEQRRAPRDRLAQRPARGRAFRISSMVAPKAPSPGSTSASARAAAGIAGQHGLRPRVAEALGDAAQVADAVVDDRDHSEPLVLGTPFTRGSRATAIAQRPGRGLEQRLRDVVRVAAAQRVEVQVEAAVVGEGPEEVLEQLGRQVAHLLRLERSRRSAARAGPRGRPRSARAPRRAARRRGRSGRSPSCRRAPAAAPRRGRCPRPRRVWWASTCRSPLHRTSRSKRRVGGERRQHVVEEADPGRDLRPALRRRGPGPAGCRSRASCARRAPSRRRRGSPCSRCDVRTSAPVRSFRLRGPCRARAGTPRSPPRCPRSRAGSATAAGSEVTSRTSTPRR